MTFYAINGSPGKNRNTAAVLTGAPQGVTAERPQARTELVHLYDSACTGCVICFACKRLGGESYGRCAPHDGLAPLPDKISEADGIVLGSPVFFHGITGKMKMFLERLLFPFAVYDAGYSSLAPRKMPTDFPYTMNVPYEIMLAEGYPQAFRGGRSFFWKNSFPGRRSSTPTIRTSSATTRNTRRTASPQRKRRAAGINNFQGIAETPSSSGNGRPRAAAEALFRAPFLTPGQARLLRPRVHPLGKGRLRP